MAIFPRRTPAPVVRDYRNYRPLVREDFRECCAYCLFHESLASGPENFELDHFHPRSIVAFADRVNDFYNIYYSCHVCNHAKGATWPSQNLVNAGYRFVDPCTETFSEHFREAEDGYWTPLTKAGEYTATRLRLNRQHLIEIRLLLRDIASLLGLEPPNWNSPSREALLRFRL